MKASIKSFKYIILSSYYLNLETSISFITLLFILILI